MEEREARFRLAAAEHADYVVGRAQAAVDGLNGKLAKLREQVKATEDALKAAKGAHKDAKDAHGKAQEAAREVPDEFRDVPAGAVHEAQAEAAEASGSVD